MQQNRSQVLEGEGISPQGSSKPSTLLGLFLVGLPEKTLEVVQAICRETGMTEAQVLSEAVNEMAKRVLRTPEVLKKP
jgi:hypothetical protein